MLTTFKSHKPQIDSSVFIEESANIIGQVSIEENSNIWYNTVVRGDVEKISVGKETNIQDNSVVHTSKGHPTTIGDQVTIGHGAIIHGCTIESNVLVGMGAIVLDGAYIESFVMVGAGTLVPPNKRIPTKTLVVGSPAKVVRSLTDEEIESIKQSAIGYVEVSQQYKSK